jgi:hypothetical protein
MYYIVLGEQNEEFSLACGAQDNRFGDRISVEARFSLPVQTGPEAHPASYIMDAGPFPEGEAAGA